MNPNNNKYYRKEMRKAVDELNREYDPPSRWGEIIGVGIAIAVLSFYNNTCVQYKAVSKAIDSLEQTEVKKDSLEYKIK